MLASSHTVRFVHPLVAPGEPRDRIGGVDAKHGPSAGRRLHPGARDCDRVQVADPLRQHADAEFVVRDAAAQGGLRVGAAVGGCAGSPLWRSVDRHRIAANAGEWRRTGRVAEADAEGEGRASDPARNGPGLDRRGPDIVEPQRHGCRRALLACSVLEPDFRTVGAGGRGHDQRPDPVADPAEAVFADRRSPRIDDPVVGHDERWIALGGAGPAEREAVLGVPGIRTAGDAQIRRPRRARRCRGGTREQRTREGRRCRNPRQRLHGPNSPAALPLDASVDSAADGADVGSGGCGAYSTAPASTASGAGAGGSGSGSGFGFGFG